MAHATSSSRSSLLEIVFDDMPIGVAVFDREFRLREFNEVWAGFVERYTETSAGGLSVGMHIRDIAPSMATYLERQWTSVLTGRTVNQTAVPLENETGVSYWDLVFRPLIEEGEITGIIDVTTEATARVVASQLADQRETQFQQVFNSTSDAIIINDPATGIVVAANPAACALHGYERDEFIGLHPSQFIRDDFLPLFAQYIDTVNKGGTFRARAVDVRKDGTEFDVEVSGTIFDYAGKPHLLAVVRDVGDQVRSERELEERVAERTRELGMLLDVSHSIASTHDLNTLLDLVLDRLRPVVNYTAAAVFVLEGDVLRLLKYRGPLDQARIERNWPLVRSLHSRQVIHSRAPVVIPDVYADEPLAQYFRDVAIDQLGHVPGYIGTWMGVPLLANDRAIGMIAFDHAQVGYYTEKHAALALAFANQAAAAVETTRLFEKEATNSRELTTLLDLARSISSTLEVDRLLDLVLEQLHRLVRYGSAAVLTVDGPEAVMAACRMNGAPYPAAVGQRFAASRPSAIQKRLASGGRILIPDVYTDNPMAAEYRAAMGARAGTLFGATRSWVAVPLAVSDRLFGMLTLAHEEPDFFTEHDAELAAALAHQASIAIENARLFTETQARTRELRTLLEVSRTVTSTLELQALLDVVLEQLYSTMEYVAASVFDVYNDDLRTLARHFRGTTSSELPAEARRIYPMDEVPVNRAVIDGREPIIIDDIHGDTPMARTFRGVWDTALRDRFEEVHSWMGVPLIAKGRVIGMLAVEHTQPKHWSSRHAALAMAFANEAAAAIENARLFAQAEQRANEMEALSRVASTLTIDQPTSATLDAIASRVVDATHAIACSVTVVRNREFLDSGGAGLPREFGYAMFSAIREGAPSALVSAVRSRKRRVIRDARRQLLQEPLYAPVHPWLADAEWDTVVITPLVSRGETSGTLDTYYPHGYEPDEDELALVAAIADQAAIAIDNRRLFAETERRLKEAQALTHVASSLTFAQPIERTLETMAESVVSATPAVASSLAMFDDDRQPRLAGAYGLPTDYLAALVESWRHGMAAETVQMLEDQEPRIIRDARRRVREETAYRPIYPFMDVVEWDTILLLPVVYQGRSVGVLSTYYLKEDEPNDAEIQLVQAIADQAAVAIENARLFADSQLRIREMDALYRADEQLHQSLQLKEVLQALVDVAVDILQADKSLVVMLDPKTHQLGVAVARGFAQSTLEAADGLLANLQATTLANRQHPLSVDDAINDPRSLRAVTEPEGIRAYVDVPILIGDQVFGVFNVSYSEPRSFSEGDKRLLTALSQRAAAAIENARLFERSQRAASLEERQRLARELHDSVSQALYGIALGAKTARTQLDRDPERAKEPLDYVLTLAEAGLAELRSLIFELRPESLETEGLVAAFSKQFAALRARHQIEVVAHVGDEPDVPIAVKEGVYRIGQEALHNTVKHARASRVIVHLSEESGGVVLSVSDNGGGFDTSGNFPGHMGLQSMMERARAINGELTIHSSPTDGTTVRLKVPAQPAE